jgi:hypothetical protein
LGFFWFLIASLQPAFAEMRVALVIGNSAYQNVNKLANPGNDSEVDGPALHSDRAQNSPAARTGPGLRSARALHNHLEDEILWRSHHTGPH